METNETFCLRWNDFESNISVAFRQIREEKDLFDCTLSCGSRQIQAHKLILSACSPFFRSILRQNPHHHPLLYLKGVQITDLQAVLDFMYHGKVNVANEDLSSFLAVAEDLQVKGLTENTKKTENLRSAKSLDNPAPLIELASFHPTPQSSTYDVEDEIEEVLPIVKIESNSDQLQPQHLHLPSDFDPNLTETQKGVESQMASVEDSYLEGDVLNFGEYESGVGDISKGRENIHLFSY